MKTIVYSCVSGNYDNKMTDRLYLPPCDRFISHRMNAKLPKIMPHKFFKDADYTIWTDSNFIFKIEPLSLIEYFNYPKVGVFSHIRKTINQEIDVCNKLKLDDVYRLEYHKNKPGLLACGFLIIRKNIDEVNILNEQWWAEICAGSSRDQLSFPYTLGTIATYKELPDNDYTNNRFWCRLPHKNFNMILKIKQKLQMVINRFF